VVICIFKFFCIFMRYIQGASAMDSRHLQFDAFSAMESLRDQYVDFLCDQFRLEGSGLGDQLRYHWRHEDNAFSLFSPPLIQGAFPFRPGEAPAQLQSASTMARDPQRPLHPKTVKLLSDAGIDYRLYVHQTEAIRAASAGQTVVLSAGTGSGKTEAFLIPLLDRMFWDHEQGLDDLSEPGVRAVILYPLNALVNNQTDRLQALLRGQQEVTFAYYTSRLRETRKSAEGFYRNRDKLQDLPASQIIDRQTLRGLSIDPKRPNGPPHILVTNFSMLQYMLIRPADRTLFQDAHTRHQKGEVNMARLKMIVLDEAHVYAGAMAAEIHMLLRRAALRFGTKLEDVQGMATSATLSAGGEETTEGAAGEGAAGEALRSYAAQMFAKPADKVTSIVGHRYLPSVDGGALPPVHEGQGLALAPPEQLTAKDAQIPLGLQTIALQKETATQYLTTDSVAVNALAQVCVNIGLIDKAKASQVAAETQQQPARFLYEVLGSHPQVMALRAWLFEQERLQLPTLDEVAAQLYGPSPAEDGALVQRRRVTHTILRLASMARSGVSALPLIPAKMHAFVRAPAGVWVSPRPQSAAQVAPHWPWGQLSASPSGEADGEHATLRMLVCDACGAPYLEAWEVVNDWDDRALYARLPDDVEEGAAHARVLLYRPQRAGEPQPQEAEDRRFVTLKSEWGGQEALVITPVEHEGEEGRRKRPLKLKNSPCCGCRACEVIALETNPRSARGVIVDALYPHLGTFPSKDEAVRLPGGGRRLMTFSDSRQETAKVAVDIEETHDEGLARGLIWRVLRDVKATSLLLRELVEDEMCRHPSIFELSNAENISYMNTDLLADLCCVWVYREFAHGANARVLERLGLVEIIYPGLDACSVPESLVGFFQPQDWHALLATTLDDMRRRGAVRKPSVQTHNPDIQDIFPWGADKVLRWTPPQKPIPDEAIVWLYQPKGAEQQNLYNFIERLRARLGEGAPQTPQILNEIWQAFDTIVKRSLLETRWLSALPVTEENPDPSFRIDLRFVRLRAHAKPSWIDPASGQAYVRAILGVSPQRDASSVLRSPTAAEVETWRRRHSVRRVIDGPLLGLWSIEHTAQLDPEALEDQESHFRSGKRNLLASSTTMEMGIDLGGLTCVLLTNVPPGPANYWQRAGRAGRRADGSALILTLCLPRPLDQKVFLNPRRFLHDDIVPPIVRLDTSPLIRRHAHALLLSRFFEEVVKPSTKGNPTSSFGRVEDFLFGPESHVADNLRAEWCQRLAVTSADRMANVFSRWLSTLLQTKKSNNIDELQSYLAGTALQDEPIKSLIQTCQQTLAEAIESTIQEHALIESKQAEEESKSSPDRSLIFALRYQKGDLENETVISYLASLGFLPSFGFPLGVVRLNTLAFIKEKDAQAKLKTVHIEDGFTPSALRMERDIAIALSEYIPGHQVLADKRVYTVRGIVRNWFDDQDKVKRRFYMICNQCKHFEESIGMIDACAVCKHPTIAFPIFQSQQSATGSKKKKATASLPGAAPSVVRDYLIPSGFAVKLNERPHRYGGTLRRGPSARIAIYGTDDAPFLEHIPNTLSTAATQAHIFIHNDGSERGSPGVGFGYCICRACGYTIAEQSWDLKKLPPDFRGHDKLRGAKRCSSESQWRHMILGSMQPAEVLCFRLAGGLAPSPDLGPETLEDWYLTLASLLQNAAATRLRVDVRTLRAAVSAYECGDTFGLQAVIYDPSSAGMLTLLHDPQQTQWLMNEVCHMLLHRSVADLIRFDTQFLAQQGKLRIDMLRKHFIDDQRWDKAIKAT
jgi:DEAD/DEAH box helicase domain-containing protein